MSRKSQFFLLLAMHFLSQHLQASVPCSELFASGYNQSAQDRTEDFIAYLETLLEHRVLTADDLRWFVAALDVGTFINPIPEDRIQVNSAALLHRGKIQEYIDAGSLNQQRVLARAKQKLSDLSRFKSQREHTRVETQDPHHKIEFFPIPPGTFEFGEYKDRTTLTHSFEMMSTLVTQNHWLSLMGKNPSKFQGPDHPVENITWWSAVMFANKLSEKHGLKPAYNFDDIKFKGSADDGSLDVEDGELKINAPGGNILLAGGYRLPTEVEQEYVLRNLGRAKTRFYFGDDEKDLIKHTWYSKNSSNTTHPVAELLPFTIGSGNFFDLYGNVWEWAHDYDGRHTSDPIRGLRGGTWHSEFFECSSNYRVTEDAGCRGENLGFRLVRTLLQ